MRERLEQEPAVAHAEVHRRLPSTIIVRVQERVPWATVKVGGVCYTIDKDLVPFRKGRTPPAGLPLVVLEGRETGLRLGKRVYDLGVREATECLQWAAARDDFPMTTVRVDQTGKLCLNRDGGAEIRLGSAMDLGKKLDTLASLLAQREDVAKGDFAYINLYAFDAPAILPKPPVGDRPRSDSAVFLYPGGGASGPPDQ